MKDIFVIIPTLNPDLKLMKPFIEELKTKFDNILVFDDGSREEFQSYYKSLEKQGIIVLHHYINLGKGRALKDAYNYLLCNYSDLKGVVTADCDGQHLVKDIVALAKAVIKHPDSLILGCRNFDDKDVPTRNKIGNKITRNVMNLFVGIKITDTQTGLRAMSKDIMIKLIDSKGERFDYETTTLVDTTIKDIPIYEVGISTVYLEGSNEGSHFNVITDSISIYKTFFKYILASTSSFIIDILLFTIFNKYLLNVVIATIIARIISSLYNYFVNAKVVFKKANKSSIFKYFILVLVQMFVSAYSVKYLTILLRINSTLIKVVVDLIIFIVNYYIQKKLIFRSK